MSVHQGHRARVKERFSREGLDGFSEHQVLELLLFYAIPQRDTNEIAHNLLNRFGTLSDVFNAPVKELKKVEGMGENVAIFISLIRQLKRYCHMNATPKATVLNSLDECGDYLVPFFEGLVNETAYLLCLDAKRKVISCRPVDEGDVNSTGVSIRKVVDMALTENATSVILAHNHTSGVAVPSADDVQTTYQIANALQFIGVTLVDHFVIADGDYVSMVHSNYFLPLALTQSTGEATV